MSEKYPGMTQPLILVTYDAHGSLIEGLAEAIRIGASSVNHTICLKKHINSTTKSDLSNASAIILGSPNWSGITGNLKKWLDDQGDLWEEGVLRGKLGAAFTTGRGQNSGIEFTLLSLLHWMLACGMVIVGLPWSSHMLKSSSYYGASAVGDLSLSDLHQAESLGRRVAHISLGLATHVRE